MEAIEKCPLFVDKKEIAFIILFLVAIFCWQLFEKYDTYRNITASRIHTATVSVENQYLKTKNKKRYTVFKLRSEEGYRFYTTSYEDLKDLRGRELELKFVTDRIGFLDFLGGFYAPSFDLRLMEKRQTLRGILLEKIADQHEDPKMQALFQALFLGAPIPKILREEVSYLGISHLIAISGFHLGVLFGALYALLRQLYRPIHNRLFPWRNMRQDLSVTIILLLWGYVTLVGYLPSLLRSFVMLVIGFWLYHRHIRLFSFSALALAVGVILALMPEFLFSIGFWFSVSGVFFIYLFLHHFGHLEPWRLFVGINLWVYLLMIPITHSIFPAFSWHQLFSPLLSMLFGFFYPLELGLHLIGAGEWLDPLLESLFSLRGEVYRIETPLWFLGIYLLVAVASIRWRRLLGLPPLLAFLFVGSAV